VEEVNRHLLRQREGARRLFHLCGLLLYPLGKLCKAQALFFWTGLICGVTLLEALRLGGKGRRFFRLFMPLMREEERRRPSGTFWYIWGVGLAFLLFPEKAALSGLVVLALADGLAGLFPQGKIHSAIFWGTSLLVATLLRGGFSWELLLKAGLWTLVEALPQVNDNFTLPLAVSLTWNL